MRLRGRRLDPRVDARRRPAQALMRIGGRWRGRPRQKGPGKGGEAEGTRREQDQAAAGRDGAHALAMLITFGGRRRGAVATDGREFFTDEAANTVAARCTRGRDELTTGWSLPQCPLARLVIQSQQERRSSSGSPLMRRAPPRASAPAWRGTRIKGQQARAEHDDRKRPTVKFGSGRKS